MIQAASVIIPCYNEENNLKRGVLKQIDDYLIKQEYLWEVIIVDDQSTDQSPNLIKKFIKNKPYWTLLTIKHGGKPLALWAGLKKSKYPIIIFTDMDQSTPIDQIEKLLPYFDQSYDIVIGSRGRLRQNSSVVRLLMSQVFLTIRRLLLLNKIVDTQCGFKAFRRQVLMDIFPLLNAIKSQKIGQGWTVSAYDVELLFIAQKRSYSIREVKVHWRQSDTSTTKGDAAARFKKESIQMAREIFRVKLNDFRQFYEV